MSEYRIRSTGEVKTQGEIRQIHSNTSLPRVWDSNVCDALGIDPVLASPQPSPSGPYKVVVRNGVTQDALGNWVQAWAERDMFSDYTDDDGNVLHTKSELEAEYQARLDAEAAKSVRDHRDNLLKETDWMTLRSADTATPVPSAWHTYRQALRNISIQDGFPHSVVWPTKPE